jgi:nucleoside-diphosphate-sugar epimerase
MDDRKEVVIVTGSSGLIGYALANRLQPAFAVVGFDREGPPYPPPSADCAAVDVTSDASVQQALAGVRERYGSKIASVVHLAAYYSFSGEPSPKYEEVTVRGTERLLRELQAFEVEQFVFSSTVLAYAACQPGQRIDDDWPLEPAWAYPQSKVDTEQVIDEEHGAIPYVFLRIAGVYDDQCHSIPLAHQIQRIYERKLISRVFPGSTAHGQPFVHLDDLLDAILLAVERRRALPDKLALLIGEPETLSYDELQHSFGRLIHGEDWETRGIPKTVAKTGAWLQDAIPGEEPFIKPWMIDRADDHYALDVSRARDLLDWEPRRSLRNTLPVMVEQLKTDPLAWYRINKLDPPDFLNAGSSA